MKIKNKTQNIYLYRVKKMVEKHNTYGMVNMKLLIKVYKYKRIKEHVGKDYIMRKIIILSSTKIYI